MTSASSSLGSTLASTDNQFVRDSDQITPSEAMLVIEEGRPSVVCPPGCCPRDSRRGHTDYEVILPSVNAPVDTRPIFILCDPMHCCHTAAPFFFCWRFTRHSEHSNLHCHGLHLSCTWSTVLPYGSLHTNQTQGHFTLAPTPGITNFRYQSPFST